ncbi:hypothetical protein ACFX13_016260 [Malus domestica]|uniref:Secreted protein n=1 Tax=Malus domestica TaxID=3750 RepID=A0A498I0M6_MALDO|nr:hypothetical protein DVH24_023440 [Malus domestica]
MARTGVMICRLLLFLKFFPTAEEAMNYYNHKRSVKKSSGSLKSDCESVKYLDFPFKLDVPYLSTSL